MRKALRFTLPCARLRGEVSLGVIGHGQQHHGRLQSYQAVGELGGHVRPVAGLGIDRFGPHREAEVAGKDLHDAWLAGVCSVSSWPSSEVKSTIQTCSFLNTTLLKVLAHLQNPVRSDLGHLERSSATRN